MIPKKMLKSNKTVKSFPSTVTFRFSGSLINNKQQQINFTAQLNQSKNEQINANRRTDAARQCIRNGE
jgi:hypothetical protein